MSSLGLVHWPLALTTTQPVQGVLSVVSFWPETLLQWVQVGAFPATLIAIGVAIKGNRDGNRWRHEEFEAERMRLASSVVALIGTEEASVFPAGSHVQINFLRLNNDSGEVIKSVEFSVIDRTTGQAVDFIHMNGDVVKEVLLTRLGPGEEKAWQQITSRPHKLVDVDGEARANLSPRVTWTDAAGWRWRMEANGEPGRLPSR